MRRARCCCCLAHLCAMGNDYIQPMRCVLNAHKPSIFHVHIHLKSQFYLEPLLCTAGEYSRFCARLCLVAHLRQLLDASYGFLFELRCILLCCWLQLCSDSGFFFLLNVPVMNGWAGPCSEHTHAAAAILRIYLCID